MRDVKTLVTNVICLFVKDMCILLDMVAFTPSHQKLLHRKYCHNILPGRVHRMQNSNSCFLQLHLCKLQPVVQLQCTIFSNTSGAGVVSIMIGISLPLCISLIQPQSVGCMPSFVPIQIMTCSYAWWEWTFEADTVAVFLVLQNTFAMATFLHRYLYLKDARESDCVLFYSEIIAWQPTSSTTVLSFFGEEKIFAEVQKTESPLMTFWRTDFFSTPNIIEVVLHPLNAWVQTTCYQKHHHLIHISAPLCCTRLDFLYLIENTRSCRLLLHYTKEELIGLYLLQ